MEPINVVLLQSDPGTAQSLSASLSHTFRSVRATSSVEELRNTIARQRAQVVVLDLEKVPLRTVAQLLAEFPKLCIVCTHRLADEQMWVEVLNAGAVDICPSTDSQAVLSAALRNLKLSRQVAA
jgi:DNA-binding NarL/FixJ family response regulator